VKQLDYYLQNKRIKQALSYIRDGDDVLDIGSGDGALFRSLDRSKLHFSGIGLDPEIKEDLPKDHYKIFKDRFPSEKLGQRLFAVITALAVLEHIPQEELNLFVRNCREQLKPGGLMIITVPSKWVDPILKFLIAIRVIDGMEVEQHHGYATGQTRPLFTQNGFEMLDHKKFQLGLNNLFVFRKINGK
jgi:2-polyprenyl-3-methyl-5-hydroxy-6-metoxy-1,4-benzoquinol methylase